MENRFTINYIKIYFWQFLSVLLGLASLFLVIPYLSSNKSIYGIYSICTSLTIFYSYADIGFLSAGQKYASEYFAKNDINNEIKIISFTSFILFVFISLVSLIVLYISFHPQILISELNSDYERNTAKQLLTILALTSPLVVCQRTLQVIFSVRVKDYVFQRFNVIGNIIKIISTLYFFGIVKYNIVGYFLFMQIINLLIIIICIIYVKNNYKYSLKTFTKEFKFNRLSYNHVNSLAYTSLVLTISWIIYYELDQFFIGKFLGANSAATYAIAFSVLTLFRSFLGIFYSPFTARFNHFVGIGDFEGLKIFFTHILKILLPVVVLPILIVSILSRPFVLSWVGPEYTESIEILSTLIFCNIFGFISYPAGALFVSLERIRILHINAILIPVIYWGGIILTFNYLHLKAFAIFKVIAFIISGMVYLYFSLSFIKLSAIQFWKSVISPYVIPIIFSISLPFYIKDLMSTENSTMCLLINITTIALLILGSFLLSFISSGYLRTYLYYISQLVFKKL